jgi:arylsulfatase A-like enzyme
MEDSRRYRERKMKRRDFVKTLGLGAASVVLPRGLNASRQASDKALEDKPNIIFILADDLGYADIGCYGQRHIVTPNIDRLAEEGTRFTNCYAGSTVCAPSRSVLMTGQHTGHTRVRANFGEVGGVGPQKRVPLEAEDVTVAEVLKEAGYATGITGKWGLGEPDTTGVPNRQGFDEWFGYLNQRNAHSYYTPYLWRNEEKVILEGNEEGKREQYTHDMFTGFALDFVQRHRSRPFFLYLAWCIPHARYEVPSIEPYSDREQWSAEERAFAAMVTRMDRDVGRVAALLRQLDLDEKTTVFFCSDNGAQKRWEGRFDSCGALRGQKGTLYEGGIRTPMIVRWPGKVPARSVSDAVWYFADFLPTAAELADVRPPSNIDGISVLPILLGKKQNLSDRFLYWEYPGGGLQQAVRWRNWKALRRAPDRKLELYDLADDVSEATDVAFKHPEIVARIEDYLKTARTESPNWPT